MSCTGKWRLASLGGPSREGSDTARAGRGGCFSVRGESEDPRSYGQQRRGEGEGRGVATVGAGPSEQGGQGRGHQHSLPSPIPHFTPANGRVTPAECSDRAARDTPGTAGWWEAQLPGVRKSRCRPGS